MPEPRLLVVTQPTRLEELRHRFNTDAQARFWVERMGQDFGDYVREHDVYQQSLDQTVAGLARLGLRLQSVDRALVPNFLFTPEHVVVTVGRDGLVVNVARYLTGQPVVAVNPDPTRWDGVLARFDPTRAALGVRAACDGRNVEEVTMAEARLNDGQRLLALNDILVGRRTHVSARYRLTFGRLTEEQSSSGVLVSTGAGSTGWLSSAWNMASAVNRLVLGEEAPALPRLRLGWTEPRLAFVVREPFRSRRTGVGVAAGLLEEGQTLRLESLMPEGGALFSDGREDDALAFDSGTVVEIGVSAQRTRLAVPPGGHDTRRRARSIDASAALV